MTNVHANLVQVFGKGVLITGKPGIGKSELTLNLLDRRHFFVADDLVSITMQDRKGLSFPRKREPSSEFELPCHGSQILRAWDDNHGKLHIRDIGLIDIEKLYPKQLLPETQIKLSVELTKEKHEIKEGPTTGPSILDNIPHYKICITGRQNLALLIEVLAKTS